MWVEKSTWGLLGTRLEKSHTALEFNNIPGERRNMIHAHKPSHSRQTLERHPALFLPAALTGRWFQSQPDNSRTPDRVIESFAMSGSPALASHPTPPIQAGRAARSRSGLLEGMHPAQNCCQAGRGRQIHP